MKQAERNLVPRINRRLAKMKWPLKPHKSRSAGERTNFGEFFIVCSTRNEIRWSNLTQNQLIEIANGTWDEVLQRP